MGCVSNIEAFTGCVCAQLGRPREGGKVQRIGTADFRRYGIFAMLK